MNTFDYDPKKGYRVRICQRCGKRRKCCQHHLERGSKRSHSKVVWVCTWHLGVAGCHEEIHADVTQAYREGWLVRNKNNSYKKKMKDKKCSHGAVYFDTEKDCLVCQFCKKEQKEAKTLKKKKS